MLILFLVNIVGTDEDNFDRHLAIKLYRERDGFRSAVHVRQAHRGNYRAERVSSKRDELKLVYDDVCLQHSIGQMKVTLDGTRLFGACKGLNITMRKYLDIFFAKESKKISNRSYSRSGKSLRSICTSFT